ncbi:TniQ family protein [Ruminiclostridium cellobioparum]|uniref:TniQ family protein n=1 Tax=Ruminiclostridium cellobioparum TaxID=29355 RepID=UPI0028A64470|nr:TniQ family protein [Ruminiclostridium cellobioparum]
MILRKIINMSRINIVSDKNWSSTLPIVDLPLKTESLLGYLFRLDYVNDLRPGSILEKSLWHSEKSLPPKLVDIEIIESNIDYSYLSSILGVPESVIKYNTLSEIRKRIYGYDNSYTKKLLYYDKLKICPICIKEWMLPICFSFYNFDTCIKHGTKLINTCICGTPINRIGLKKSKCTNKLCKKSYTDILIFQSPKVIEEQRLCQTLFNDVVSGNVSLIDNEKNKIESLKSRVDKANDIFQRVKNCIAEAYYQDFYGDIGPYGVRPFRFELDLLSIIWRLKYCKLTPYQFSQLIYLQDSDLKIWIKDIYIKTFSYETDSNSDINRFDFRDPNPVIKYKIGNANNHFLDRFILYNGITMYGQVCAESSLFQISLDFELRYERCPVEGFYIYI